MIDASHWLMVWGSIDSKVNHNKIPNIEIPMGKFGQVDDIF